MTIKTFQTRVVAGLRRGLKRGASSLELFRKASREALHLCGRHHDKIPDSVASAFERRYASLWKSQKKRGIV